MEDDLIFFVVKCKYGWFRYRTPLWKMFSIDDYLIRDMAGLDVFDLDEAQNNVVEKKKINI